MTTRTLWRSDFENNLASIVVTFDDVTLILINVHLQNLSSRDAVLTVTGPGPVVRNVPIPRSTNPTDIPLTAFSIPVTKTTQVADPRHGIIAGTFVYNFPAGWTAQFASS